MTMQKKNVNNLFLTTKIALGAIGIGLTLFLVGLFVSGSNYFISATGIGIIIASLIVIFFGMSISLMEEYGENSKHHQQLRKGVTAYSKKPYH
jgi:1,4-dihydroxy-2-naphthoate octaprenyltransferase